MWLSVVAGARRTMTTIFCSALTSTTAVVAGEHARPQVPPPHVASSQSSSPPPCRSGRRFGALAARSWPLRSPSAAARLWCRLPSEEPPQETTRHQPSEVLTYKCRRGKSQLQLRIRLQDIGTHVFYPFFFFATIAPHRCSDETSVFFSGTLQVEYGLLTVMHVVVLIIVMLLA
jgi:hypothetical protein